MIIREATAKDGNLYPNYDPNIIEKKFSMVVILGECDEQSLDYLRQDQNAMDINEVLPNAGVYRPLG